MDSIVIRFDVMTDSHAKAQQAVEALSRVATGLALDGIMVECVMGPAEQVIGTDVDADTEGDD